MTHASNIVALQSYIDSNVILMKGITNERFCSGIWCYNGEDIMTLDGTTCGNNNWCHNGRCVYDSRAAQLSRAQCKHC